MKELNEKFKKCNLLLEDLMQANQEVGGSAWLACLMGAFTHRAAADPTVSYEVFCSLLEKAAFLFSALIEKRESVEKADENK